MSSIKLIKPIVKEYKYLSEQDLPKLFLGLNHTNPRYHDFVIQPQYNPVKIAHQTAGIMCNQHYLYGIILNPKNNAVKNCMKILSGKYLDSNISNPSLQKVVEYNTYIKAALNIECQNSYRDLEEAIYPIDATAKNIAKLSTFNTKISNLVVPLDKNIPKNKFRALMWDLWFQQSLSLYILGENCD